MKKINLLLIAILLVVTVSAQNKRAEKKLVGSWTLQEVEIENIDELAQSILDMQIGLMDQQIAYYEEQIKDNEFEDDKKENLEQLEIYKAQKEELTLESQKEEFTKEFENLKGNFKLIFNKDKSYQNTSDGLEQEGIWSVNKKGTELTITENETDIVLQILKLTKKGLFIKIVEETGQMKIIMNMEFIKNKK